MPMLNAGAFVAEAIASILCQTAHDFTFLIIDDGSEDDSLAIAGRLADRRTEIVADGQRLGLTARLNWGLDHARTRFVARMDADDIAAPSRLARQLAFMEATPQVGICGSWYVRAKAGVPPSPVRLPLDHESLRAATLFVSPFAHPTVMFDLQHLDAAGLRYSEAATHAEDYELWERACTKTRLANVPAFLLRYRIHGEQVSTLQGARQRAVSDGVRRRALARLGIDPTPEEALLHCDYAVGHGMTGLKRMKAARAWLDTLERTARRRGDRAVAAECAARGRRLEKRLAPLSPPTPSGVAGRIRRLLGG
jgi:hypothetical protein